jgi:uncharacterized membrane protein
LYGVVVLGRIDSAWYRQQGVFRIGFKVAAWLLDILYILPSLATFSIYYLRFNKIFPVYIVSRVIDFKYIIVERLRINIPTIRKRVLA